MKLILNSDPRSISTKSNLILALNGVCLLSDGTLNGRDVSSNVRSETKLDVKDRVLLASASRRLLILLMGSRITGYSLNEDGDKLDIGSEVILGEDMTSVTSMTINDRGWLAVALKTPRVILLLKLSISVKNKVPHIFGVTHYSTLRSESSSPITTHMNLVSNRGGNNDDGLLITLSKDNILKSWRIGGVTSSSGHVFEMSSQLGRHPLTSLAVREHFIAIGNCQGTVFFHQLTRSEKETDAAYVTRQIGVVHLAEKIQGVNVEVGCEILDMMFYTHDNRSDPPYLIVGTCLGLCVINVRTREIVCSLKFSQIFFFRENGDNCKILDFLATKMSLRRQNLSLDVAFQTTIDSKIWHLDVVLVNEDDEVIDLEDDGNNNNNNSSILSVIAKTPTLPGSFLNSLQRKLPPRKKSPFSAFGKSVPNLGKVISQVRSSGYGQSSGKRKMFCPATINKSSSSKTSSSHKSASLSTLPNFDSTKSQNKSKGERARWPKSNTKCQENTFLSYLSISSSSSTRQTTGLPVDRLSISRKIWPGKNGGRSGIRFASRGKIFASFAGTENFVQILSTSFANASNVDLVGHEGPVVSVDFAHGSSDIVVTASRDKTVRLWEWKTRVNKLTLSAKISSRNFEDDSRFGTEEFVKSGFYYMDQFLLSIAGNSLFVHQFGDRLRGQEWSSRSVKTFRTQDARHILDFSAANRFYSYLVLMTCSDKSISVLDLNRQAWVARKSNAHTRPISKLVQAEGSLLCNYDVGSEVSCDVFCTYAMGDGAKLWDLRSLSSPVQRFDWPGSDRGGRIPGSIDLSPCGKYLAVGGTDGGVYLYDTRSTGSYLERLSNGYASSPITGIAFDPTKTSLLLSMDLDGELSMFTKMGDVMR